MPIRNSHIGINTKVWEEDLVNIYDSSIGTSCNIGAFVEICGAKIGDRCSVQAFASICHGTIIQDAVFVGPRVTFTNAKKPRISKPSALEGALVRDGAVIGAGAIILPGIVIGRSSIVGAGAVVTRDVPDGATVVGNPARVME